MQHQEYRIFGPPGTGKTTWLSDQIRRAARARGSEEVIVASFTRAAATEIAGRQLPIPPDQIGTLHALCYRQLDRPEIAEGHIEEWNKTYPSLTIGQQASSNLNEPTWDSQSMGGHGDQLLQQCETLRARRIPTDLWPRSAAGFHRRWCQWKADNALVDFTDLIEMALANLERAPGSPSIGFFDEVQDFTPLELDLVRRWARHMELVLLAGDDDQCIYNFKGADASAFLDPPVDDEYKRVLAESFRVPRAVHRVAERWIAQLTRRERKDYRPRDADGRVRLLTNATFKMPDQAVRDAVDQLERGRSVMFLATCAYMIDPVKHALRTRGVPFHNPYRRKRGDWNPLTTRRNATSAAERVLAYLRPDIDVWGEDSRVWTAQDLQRWTHVCRAQGLLQRGAKARIAELAADAVTDGVEMEVTDLLTMFESEEDFGQAFRGDLDWLERQVLERQRRPMRYAIQVARQRGGKALLQRPRTVIGTIHSVKGGEADVVYLFPDLSMAGLREWRGAPRVRDAVVRQFYVGMTRAREELVVCGPAAGHVDLRRFLG